MENARGITAAAGARLLYDGRALPSLDPFAYFALDVSPDAALIEYLQPGPGLKPFFSRIEAAAQGWDGSDPVRRLG